jgi:hypothetical protein
MLRIPAKMTVLAAFPMILWKFRVLSPAETATVLATRAKMQSMLFNVGGGIFGKKRIYDC